MALAYVDGAPVSFDEAARRCAHLLAQSEQPVFAHLGTDAAGAREAILLAEVSGGVLDHMSSGAMLRDLDPLRETGGFLTTPLEADVRADVVLLLGNVKAESGVKWIFQPARPHCGAEARSLVEIAGGSSALETLKVLAQLRWAIGKSANSSAPIEMGAQAKTLRAAKFGVAIWRASDLPALAVEAVHGLVRDLNETTRFSTLPLAAPDNGVGVSTVCAWMTGFPLRTGFAGGRPEHDPWRYDAQRLIAAGETDCVLWISTLPGEAAPPEHVDILLDDGRSPLTARPRVRFIVSSPGPGAVLFDPRVGTLVASQMGIEGVAPTANTVLAAVREKMEAASC